MDIKNINEWSIYELDLYCQNNTKAIHTTRVVSNGCMTSRINGIFSEDSLY